MNYKLAILLFIFIPCWLAAQTIIPGGTINGGEWRPENSPYIVTGDVNIQFLTIFPGTVIEFNGNYRFEISYYLKADGFHSDSIIFRPAAGNTAGWRGIHFRPGSSPGSSLSYCQIEGSNLYGIQVEQSIPTIFNCRLSQINGNGLVLKGTTITFNHCRIDRNLSSGIFLDEVQLTLRNSIISGNEEAGIFSTDQSDSITVINSVIADNGEDGVDAGNIGIKINNSIIYFNGGGIITAHPAPSVTYSNIQGSTVYPGTGNINLDPQFESTDRYSLSPISPCIDAGDTLTSYNDKYFPPSLGSPRNDMGAYGGPLANYWYPPLYLKPPQYDFGKVTLDSVRQVIFKTHNYRESGITVSGISFPGSDPGVFTASPLFFFLPTPDSLDLRITFTPDSEKVSEAVLTLQTQNSGRVTLPLRGEGVISRMVIQNPQIDFGNVPVGDSAQATIGIQNNGSDTLRVQVLPPAGAAYSLSNLSLILPPDSFSSALRVTFEPDSPRVYQDSLVILSNDPTQNRVMIPLQGVGWGPVLGSDRQTLIFGSIAVNEDTLLNLTITNSGNDTLRIPAAQIENAGPDTAAFYLTDPIPALPLLIPPAGSEVFAVGFSPREPGGFTAQLVILSNDPYRDRLEIPLSGTGIAPRLAVSDSYLDFGRIPGNLDSVQIITLYNTGTANSVIYRDSLIISGPDSLSFLLDDPLSNLIVIPGDSARLSLRFLPEGSGKKEAELRILSNDPVQPRRYISLTGIGYDYQSATITVEQNLTTHPVIWGESAILALTISSLSPVDSAVLYLRKGGQSDYLTMAMQPQSGNIWYAQISPDQVTERGLEYYVRADHGWTSTLYPQNGELQPIVVTVSIPSLDFPNMTASEVYQMISIPFSTGGQNLNSLLGDDLGPYDNTQYRLFDCPNGNDYAEISGLDIPLPAGKALWLITRQEKTLDVENGQSTSTGQEFLLTLRAGWNMIATPFAFAVDWHEVSDSLQLRRYDGVDWPFVSVLEPYQGYAVYSPESLTVRIPPRQVSTGIPFPKAGDPVAADGWYFQITAEISGSQDHFNFAGAPTARSGPAIRRNHRDPPPIGHHIQLYFLHEGNTGKFSTDYRLAGADGYTFTFELAGTINGEKTIRALPENLPPEYDWTIVSTDAGINHGKDPVRTRMNHERFQLLVGSPDYLARSASGFQPYPRSFALYQNYPNPFNPETRISFQLPTTQRVSVRIYNTLGQLIKILLNDQLKGAGYYHIIWDGTNQGRQNVASGIYFMQLQTDDFNRSIKMILQR